MAWGAGLRGRPLRSRSTDRAGRREAGLRGRPLRSRSTDRAGRREAGVWWTPLRSRSTDRGGRRDRALLPLPKNNEASLRYFFIQAAGLVYHHRAKCGAYHQGRVAPLYLITRQRVSICGLMIYRNKLRMIYKASP